MDINSRNEGNVLVVAVTGRLIADSADQFKHYMSNEIVQSNQIVLDLSAMEYIDSTGLGAIVFVFQKLSDRMGKLALAALQPKPQMVFNITKAYKIFDIFDSVDEAVVSINGN